jgi:hypothetical protein
VIDHNDHKAIDHRQVVLQVVHLHLHALHVPVIALHVPVIALHVPVIALHVPVIALHVPVIALHVPVIALHVPVIALHVLLKVEAMNVVQVEVVAMIAQELLEMSPMAVLSVIHEVFVQLLWSVIHHEYVLESSSQIFQNMLPVKS